VEGAGGGETWQQGPAALTAGKTVETGIMQCRAPSRRKAIPEPPTRFSGVAPMANG